MERPVRICTAFSIILIIGIFMTGCSDSEDAASGSISDTVVVTTTAGPLYTAGDIVRSATGAESPAWLIVRYDSAGDSYTRALIYRNPDGTWGYRTSPSAETSKRTAMEKVFTVKITHVTVALVPTGAPTVLTTAETATTTMTAATTTAVATTKISTARPAIKEMDPEEGEAGTTVSTVITGSDFESNLTVLLRHAGETSIPATAVTWSSSTRVTCTFELPNTTKVGTWDIVVTNPNHLSGEITNFFMIHGNRTAAS